VHLTPGEIHRRGRLQPIPNAVTGST
jgi:hypothetical protein